MYFIDILSYKTPINLVPRNFFPAQETSPGNDVGLLLPGFYRLTGNCRLSGIIREYFYSVREVFKLWFLGSNFRLFPVNTGCCPFDIMAVGEFFFTPFILYIVPKYCHDEFFVSLNFLHGMFDSVWGHTALILCIYFEQSGGIHHSLSLCERNVF